RRDSVRVPASGLDSGSDEHRRLPVQLGKEVFGNDVAEGNLLVRRGDEGLLLGSGADQGELRLGNLLDRLYEVDQALLRNEPRHGEDRVRVRIPRAGERREIQAIRNDRQELLRYSEAR